MRIRKQDPPIVLCCYADLHPKTKRSVESYAPTARFVNTSRSPYAYRDALQNWWIGEQDLIVIEQDIEITPDVIKSFTGCRKKWCVYSYQGPPHKGYLYRSLGCTRFSARLQRQIPFENFIPYSMMYKTVDVNIARVLWTLNGIHPHVHGHVQHHHEYPDTFRHAYCHELQPNGRIRIYRNFPDGTRGSFVREEIPKAWER